MKFLSHVRYSGDGSQRENGSSLSACHVWLHASYCITTMKPSFQQKLSAQRKVWKKFNRVDPLKKKISLGWISRKFDSEREIFHRYYAPLADKAITLGPAARQISNNRIRCIWLWSTIPNSLRRLASRLKMTYLERERKNTIEYNFIQHVLENVFSFHFLDVKSERSRGWSKRKFK